MEYAVRPRLDSVTTVLRSSRQGTCDVLCACTTCCHHRLLCMPCRLPQIKVQPTHSASQQHKLQPQGCVELWGCMGLHWLASVAAWSSKARNTETLYLPVLFYPTLSPSLLTPIHPLSPSHPLLYLADLQLSGCHKNACSVCGQWKNSLRVSERPGTMWPILQPRPNSHPAPTHPPISPTSAPLSVASFRPNS